MNIRLAAFADEADGSIDGQIKALTENDMALLEIRGVDGENIADISAEKAREIKKKFDAAGVKVWSIGSPFGKMGICDDFQPHLDQFKRGLEIAHILEAEHMRMFSFYVTDEDAPKFRDEVMKRLGGFVEAAKGSGIILCHENEKGIYGAVAPRCLEIHQEYPELKAVFDPANFIQCGQDTLEAWNMLKPYVEYMHIKDARTDGHVVPAGKGEGHIPEILKEYKGEVLTVEPHLSVFAGFDKLEKDQKTEMDNYCYGSSREAFDAAVHHLKELL